MKECTRCHGRKFVTEKTKNLATCEVREAIIVCPSCSGKGYLTQADIDNYYNNWRI